MESKATSTKKASKYQPLYTDFPLKNIKLLDEYYASLTQKDVDFLNTFNPDKLLYNFRLTAGYTKQEIQDGRFDFAKTEVLLPPLILAGKTQESVGTQWDTILQLRLRQLHVATATARGVKALH